MPKEPKPPRTLKNRLEMKVSPTDRNRLLDEIPHGEALLEQVESGSVHYSQVVEPLTKMYVVMNQQLGIAAKEVGYPLDQWVWPDSLPLERIAAIYRGIETTEW